MIHLHLFRGPDVQVYTFDLEVSYLSADLTIELTLGYMCAH